MNKEKYVDESWKEQASQEKEGLSDGAQEQGDQQQTAPENPAADASGQSSQPAEEKVESTEQQQAVEINFLNYITSLGFQAMIFLGEIPNPMTNKVDKNLDQAKFLIDTLSMLAEKTAGNLTDQEKTMLENSVYELQMKYVQVSGDNEPTEEQSQ